MRSFSKVLLSAGIAAVAVGTMAGTALAEPPSTPAKTSFVAVGSDTIQGVSDAFQADFMGGNQFFSYDAFPGSANITPKQGCQAITRPNGSSAGIAALATNAHPTGDQSHFCVDIARSSRGPKSDGSDPAGLAWVPFAEDAVSWAANSTTNAPSSLTTAQLNAIYSCDDTSLGGAGDPVTWNEVGGKGTAAVVPVIPQSSSGTRSFFLSEIGVVTLGTCVKGQDDSVEENEGTNAIFNSASKANIVFPYSLAVFLAQSQHNHGAGMQGSLKPKSVNGKLALVGQSPNQTINPQFPYTRQVFYVVRSVGAAKKYVPVYLKSFLGQNNHNGYICTSAAQTIIKSYGFLSLNSQNKCGLVSLHT